LRQKEVSVPDSQAKGLAIIAVAEQLINRTIERLPIVSAHKDPLREEACLVSAFSDGTETTGVVSGLDEEVDCRAGTKRQLASPKVRLFAPVLPPQGTGFPKLRRGAPSFDERRRITSD